MKTASQIKDKVYYEFKNEMGVVADSITIEQHYASINSELGNFYYKLTESGNIKKNSLRKEFI